MRSCSEPCSVSRRHHDRREAGGQRACPDGARDDREDPAIARQAGRAADRPEVGGSVKGRDLSAEIDLLLNESDPKKAIPQRLRETMHGNCFWPRQVRPRRFPLRRRRPYYLRSITRQGPERSRPLLLFLRPISAGPGGDAWRAERWASSLVIRRGRGPSAGASVPLALGLCAPSLPRSGQGRMIFVSRNFVDRNRVDVSPCSPNESRRCGERRGGACALCPG